MVFCFEINFTLFQFFAKTRRHLMQQNGSVLFRFLFTKRNFFLLFTVLTIGLATTTFIPNQKVEGQSNPRSCPTCAPPQQQVIYAPTIGFDEVRRSEIVLNSRSSRIMEITPTFYTAEGRAITGNVFKLNPSEMRFVNIDTLLPRELRKLKNWGGISFSYYGGTLEMWAQITLQGIGGIGSSDVTFSVLNNLGSDVQEAVWYLPTNDSKAVLALGNSSNSQIHTQLQFSDGTTQEVEIAPFATKYIRRQNTNSVRLQTTGPSGSLKATGVVYNSSRRFASGIRFYEPRASVQSNLFATNFKVKDHESHLILKNTSPKDLKINPQFFPMTGKGEPFDMGSVEIKAGKRIELELKPLVEAMQSRADLEKVSVRIINDDEAGSLIGALYSVDDNTGIIQDIPLRDSGRMRNSTGAYPWRLDDDFSSVVSITNVGKLKAQFLVKIYFEGGTYTPTTQELEVGETATFDLRKIRDERIPDERGNLIPQTATVGQFNWSVLRGNESVRLNGRSEVVSLSHGVDASFSCPVCCPYT
jgi:hypothetical protein